MRLAWLVSALTLGLAPAASVAKSAPASPPIQVMVVGVFHMSNPGHDLYDAKIDDVLAPKRQREIASVTTGLERFRPTKVAVEWPADLVAERYPKYLAGTLPPSRNEVVQLGFRSPKKLVGRRSMASMPTATCRSRSSSNTPRRTAASR